MTESSWPDMFNNVKYDVRLILLWWLMFVLSYLLLSFQYVTFIKAIFSMKPDVYMTVLA